MIEVRRLRRSDDRRRFCSGDPDLDWFFQRFAGLNQFRHHVGTTYVAVDGEAIVGFLTASGAHVYIEDLPVARRKRLPRYPLPALRLARLAVAEARQGEGIGRRLLWSAFELAHEMAAMMGCVGVVVDAKPNALGFYERYGFERMETLEGLAEARPTPVPLFLPIGVIPDPRGR